MTLRILVVFFTLILILQLEGAYSAEIASCRNPKGHAFFHVQCWQQDALTGGLTTLQKLDNGKYDIFIVDIRNKILSLREDGGEVLLVRKGSQDATFLHVHPGMVIELYTFWIGKDGKAYYDLVQSKGGDEMPLHKSAVYVGDCDGIDFGLMR